MSDCSGHQVVASSVGKEYLMLRTTLLVTCWLHRDYTQSHSTSEMYRQVMEEVDMLKVIKQGRKAEKIPQDPKDADIKYMLPSLNQVCVSW